MKDNNLSIKIRILDKDYQVNCKPDEQDALKASATLLSNKMAEIRSVSNIIGIERIAVMAALNLTHDLLQSEDSAKRDAAASKLLEAADNKLNSVLFELDSRWLSNPLVHLIALGSLSPLSMLCLVFLECLPAEKSLSR